MKKICHITDTHAGYYPKTNKKIRKMYNKFIPKHNPDIIVHSGDFSCNDQRQLKYSLRFLREAFPKLPILVVKGNHDYWQYSTSYTYNELINMHNEWFKKYNIHYLQDNPFEIDNVKFFGFDGWYSNPSIDTNDFKMIPLMINNMYMDKYFQKVAEDKFYNILMNEKKEKNVLVTHFPLFRTNIGQIYGGNIKWIDFLVNDFDLLLCGHYHKNRVDRKMKRMRIDIPFVNYDKPDFSIIEI